MKCIGQHAKSHARISVLYNQLTINILQSLLDGAKCFQLFPVETWDEVNVFMDEIESSNCVKKLMSNDKCDELVEGNDPSQVV